MRKIIDFAIGTLRTAGAKGFWALGDQAIVSIGTFLVGVLLARNLVEQDYGAYALVMGILFFLNGIHNGFVTYPLSIKGSSLSRDNLGLLAGSNVLWTFVLSVPLAIVMGMAVVIVGELRHIPLAILALFAWQFHETARRGMMTHLRHRELILGDAVKFGGWALSTYFLTITGHVSLGTVLLSLAILSVIAGSIQCRQLGVRFDSRTKLRDAGRDAWRLGKLVVAGSLLSFFSVQFFSWALLAFHGLDASARMQAMVLVLGLMHPVMFSISNILVPAVSGVEQQEGHKRASYVGFSYGVVGGALVIPYFLLVAAIPETVLGLFFGSGSPYLSLDNELRIFTLTYILIYASQVLSGVLNGLRRVPAAFVSQGSGAVAAVTLGLPFIAHWGLVGAVIAGAAAFGVQVVVAIAYLVIETKLPWSGKLKISNNFSRKS